MRPYIGRYTPLIYNALCQCYRWEKISNASITVIAPQLHEALTQHSALEWETIFGESVPCAAARRVDEMFDHPQCQAEELISDFEHPVVGRYRGFTRATTFSRTPGPAPFAAPVFGADSDRVLLTSGFTPQQVLELRASGALL
ncbi:CoA transferase [Pseudomonas poae]|uniref:CoA transferase n=1 Tax=Pseudomonas poae TaxID=200451 RepID=A0A2S9ET62_9PSED|nr:CoA transferase [Pseudomonas poae]PRA27886.1 hypothetical protein CQZ97_16330 [Pseudomonas poae]PRC18990.1 hypothetical protein CQZ99_11800 [Pseudomonas poae]